MDPLSITASIIAVLQLTSKVIKYLVDVQGAPEDCQSCTTELSNFLPSLIDLKDRAERAHSNDPWFEQLCKLNSENGPLDQYKEALELLLSKVDGKKGLGKVKKRLLWSFEKEQVTSIHGRIERLRSLIATALLMDHMYNHLQRVLSEAIKADTSFVRASLLHVQADVSTLQTTARSVHNDTKNIRDNTKDIQDILTREKYRTVLEWLSSTEYPAQQQSILSRRQDGTAQWFTDSAAFRQWLQGREKKLFCPGIPGAGKTMMAAVAIDYLFRTYDSADIGIAYVFCSYKALVDQSVSSLLAAILKQLAPNNSDAMNSVTELYNKHSTRGGRPAVDELFRNLLTCVSCSTTFIIIDALDECSNKDGARDQLVEMLLRAQEKSDVRLLFTSRFIPEVVDKFRSDLQLEVRASEEDVRCFVKGQRLRLPHCVQRDETLQNDVQSKIAEAVDGMFLLARLHLDSVCAQTSPKKVRATLAQLRKGSGALDEAYADVLTRIDGQLPEHKALAQRALCWISYAERPLTVAELRIALAIEPGESALDLENLDDLDDIVSFCAGLITVDHESSVVRLVHYTTQEYLQRVRSTWAPYMQHQIAEACLTYLSFEAFRSGACTSQVALEARHSQHQFFDYAATFWSDHVRPIEQSFVDFAMKFLHHQALLESTTQVVFTSNLSYQDSNDYPRRFTALHLAARSGLYNIVRQCVIYEADSSTNNINDRDSDGGTPLYYASCHGHERAVKLLLDKGADINAQGGRYRTALYAASEGGHERLVQLLLDECADVNAGRPYRTALYAASKGGHEHIVELLLKSGADVNAGRQYCTALHAASEGGHEHIVELLLNSSADVNAGGRYRTPLYVASEDGHDQIVKLLLNKGADVNADAGAALHTASVGGHRQVVKLLLDRGANINAGGEDGAALNVASIFGHKQVVELLLDAGADIDAHSRRYSIALNHASARGHEQIVKLLLDKGADVNTGDEDRTALQTASAYGQIQVVKLLLDRGADVNACGREGTPLQAASRAGHKQVVELLLDEGADINARSNEHSSALYCASAKGHKQIVELLLEKGADVNAKEGLRGTTAFKVASVWGHEQIVKLLLSSGASPSAYDSDS